MTALRRVPEMNAGAWLAVIGLFDWAAEVGRVGHAGASHHAASRVRVDSRLWSSWTPGWSTVMPGAPALASERPCSWGSSRSTDMNPHACGACLHGGRAS